MKKIFFGLAGLAALLFTQTSLATSKKWPKNWLEKVVYLYVENYNIEKWKPFAVFDKSVARRKHDYYEALTNRPIALVSFTKWGDAREIEATMPDLAWHRIKEQYSRQAEGPRTFDTISKHIAAIRKAEIEKYGKILFENILAKKTNEEYKKAYPIAVQLYKKYANMKAFGCKKKMKYCPNKNF